MQATPLPKPMRPVEFYILLALSRGELHTYPIKAIIYNDSGGSINISRSKIYPLVQKLADEAYLDMVGPRPAGKSGNLRMHYAISEHGLLRLKEELARLDHAVKIGQAAGLMADQTPFDIQHMHLATGVALKR